MPLNAFSRLKGSLHNVSLTIYDRPLWRLRQSITISITGKTIGTPIANALCVSTTVHSPIKAVAGTSCAQTSAHWMTHNSSSTSMSMSAISPDLLRKNSFFSWLSATSSQLHDSMTKETFSDVMNITNITSKNWFQVTQSANREQWFGHTRLEWVVNSRLPYLHGEGNGIQIEITYDILSKAFVMTETIVTQHHHSWTSGMAKKTVKSIGMTLLILTARPKPLQGTGSGAWVEAILYTGNFLTANLLMSIARLAEACNCGTQLDRDDFHLLICKLGGGLLLTHNSVLSCWTDCLWDVDVLYKKKFTTDAMHTRTNWTSPSITATMDRSWPRYLDHPWWKYLVRYASQEEGHAAVKAEQKKKKQI